MEIRDFLEKNGLVAGLTDEQINQLIEIAELEEYEQGDTIIPEITRTRDLYALVTGVVSISMSIPLENRKAEMIDTLHPGELMGEISFLDGSPRSASAVAERAAVVYKFPYDRLNLLLEENPRIGYILIRGLAQKVAEKMRQTNLAWRNMMMW